MILENALARATTGTGEMIDFTGTWINQLGSEVTFRQTNGVLDGKYISKVSSTGGETIGDLSGFVDGDLISWVVHWRDFQAITAWVGQIDPNTPGQLKTLWQMTKQVAQGEEWASVNAGSDVFVRRP